MSLEFVLYLSSFEDVKDCLIKSYDSKLSPLTSVGCIVLVNISLFLDIDDCTVNFLQQLLKFYIAN